MREAIGGELQTLRSLVSELRNSGQEERADALERSTTALSNSRPVRTDEQIEELKAVLPKPRADYLPDF